MNRKNPFADITDTHTDVDRYPKEGALLSGRYRLLSIAGKGGMGLVYRAKDEHAADLGKGDEYLAIKVLSPLIREDEEAVVALKREAEMAKKLRHHNLLGVYGFETDGKWTYLISEWIDGTTLSKKLLKAIGEGKDGLPWATVKQWLPDIAEALDAAHHQGVIHRDVKPGNIMVTRTGRVVILDFGVSYQVGRTLSKFKNVETSSGTPEYIPPEAYLGGHTPHAKDDVYGLAVTIYKLLVNDEPYKELLITNRDETTPQPRKPSELSDHQWQCLMTALHHTPDKRPESAGVFVDSLLNDTKITEPKPNKSKETLWAVTLAALLGGSAIVASQYFPLKTVVVDEPVKPSEQEKQAEAKKLADEAKKVAEKDSLQQYIIGVQNYQKNNYSEAVKWYRKAAEQGVPIAQYNLGVMFYDGKGVSQSYSEAVKWFRKAADQDVAIAQFNVGLMYEHGQGVSQSDSEAVKWYRKAAEQGFASAQYNLGVMFYDGKGVSQSYSEAVKWFRKAAEQRLAKAQFNLGLMYENGRGVSQSYSEAVKWYRKAAEQGDGNARKRLRKLTN